MAVRKVRLPSGETKWEVLVRVGGRESSRLRRRFDKKMDAEAFEVEAHKERGEEKFGKPSIFRVEDLGFFELAQAWYRENRSRFSVGHAIRSEGILRQLMGHWGEIPVMGVTPEVLALLQERLLAEEYSQASVNRVIEVAKAILNYGVRARKIPFNPAAGFRKTRAASETQFWSLDEARSFLGCADQWYPPGSPDRWVYVVFLLAINCGLRAGEIWGLKVMDINWSKGTITVRRQYHRILKAFAETKTDRVRNVPCGPSLREELRAVIEARNRKLEDAIFCNDAGKPYDHDNFKSRIFPRILEAWGGRRIRFHDLRHTAATLMTSANVDLKTVKEVLGHASIATTMGYLHTSDQMIARLGEEFMITPARKERRTEA